MSDFQNAVCFVSWTFFFIFENNYVCLIVTKWKDVKTI